VIQHECPAYARIDGARVLHIRNVEGMTGGQMTIQFELPASRLPAFFAASPLRDVPLDSKVIPNGFVDAHWLPPQRYEELQKNEAYTAGSFTAGRTYYSVLIDRTRPDLYVIYLQVTS